MNVLVKYTGSQVGPVLTTPLLSKEYDFSTGSCTMTKDDADLLIQRCGHSYEISSEVPEAKLVIQVAKPKSVVPKGK